MTQDEIKAAHEAATNCLRSTKVAREIGVAALDRLRDAALLCEAIEALEPPRRGRGSSPGRSRRRRPPLGRENMTREEITSDSGAVRMHLNGVRGHVEQDRCNCAYCCLDRLRDAALVLADACADTDGDIMAAGFWGRAAAKFSKQRNQARAERDEAVKLLRRWLDNPACAYMTETQAFLAKIDGDKNE